MEVHFTPSFVKQFNALESLLQTEVEEKIELFKDKTNHKRLKVPALHGRLAGLHSFSVNYAYRIVFEYLNAQETLLLKVGTHHIYK